MTAAILIAKLLEVEKTVGNAHPSTVRSMVLDAQGCVLEIEQEMIELLRGNLLLRERLERYEQNNQSRTPRLRGFSEVAADLSRVLGRRPLDLEAPVAPSLIPDVLA